MASIKTSAEVAAEASSAGRGIFRMSPERKDAKYSRLEMDMGDDDDAGGRRVRGEPSRLSFAATAVTGIVIFAVLFFGGISYGRSHSHEHLHHQEHKGSGGAADGIPQITVEKESDPCRIVGCPLPASSMLKEDRWRYDTIPLAVTCCSQLNAFLSSPSGPSGFDFSKEDTAGTLCRGECFLSASLYLDCRKSDYTGSDACRSLKEGCLSDLGTILDAESDGCPKFVNCPALGTESNPSIDRQCCSDVENFYEGDEANRKDLGGSLCGGTCRRTAMIAAVMAVTDQGGGSEIEDLMGACKNQKEQDTHDHVVAAASRDVRGRYWVSCATVRDGLPKPVEGYSFAMDRQCCEGLADYTALIGGPDGEWRENAVQLVGAKGGGGSSMLCKGDCFESAKDALRIRGASDALNNICSDAYPDNGIEKAEEVEEMVVDPSWKENIQNEEKQAGGGT